MKTKNSNPMRKGETEGDYVSPEAAELLKEAGFPQDGQGAEKVYVKLCDGNYALFDAWRLTKAEPPRVAAPRRSEALRWMRSEGVVMEIAAAIDGQLWMPSAWVGNFQHICGQLHDEKYNTFEEAEAALVEAVARYMTRGEEPSVEQCCGSCMWFNNEDIDGVGWCAGKEAQRACDEVCRNWEGKGEGRPDPQECCTVKGWIARDDDGEIYFYTSKPSRGEYDGYWDGYWEANCVSMKLPADAFRGHCCNKEPAPVILQIKDARAGDNDNDNTNTNNNTNNNTK